MGAQKDRRMQRAELKPRVAFYFRIKESDMRKQTVLSEISSTNTTYCTQMKVYFSRF